MHLIDTHVHFSLLDPTYQKWSQRPDLNQRLSGYLGRIKNSMIGKSVKGTLRLLHRSDNYLMTPFQWQPLSFLYQAATLSTLPINGVLDEIDLLANMERNGFSHAVVIFYSQFQDVLQLSQKIHDANQLIWGTTISGNLEMSVQEETLLYIQHGASCLYFHPMNDRRTPESIEYEEIMSVAKGAGLPVILRTGFSQIPGQRDGSVAHLSRWLPLLQRYSDHPFVISHCNMTDPLYAIEVVSQHENLMLDMAWQNPWVFNKSYDKLGSSKMMLASDWPVFGDTESIQRRLLTSCQMSNQDVENVAYRNAQALFKTFKL